LGRGFRATKNEALLFLEHAWLDDTDDHQAGNDQSQRYECDEKDAASAGWKFAAYDPVLDIHVSLDLFHRGRRYVGPYLAFEIPPASD